MRGVNQRVLQQPLKAAQRSLGIFLVSHIAAERRPRSDFEMSCLSDFDSFQDAVTADSSSRNCEVRQYDARSGGPLVLQKSG